MSRKSIGAAKFKEQCLALLDQLDSNGLIITKHNKPVARLIPYREVDADLIGCAKGKIEIQGDILSTDVNWKISVKPQRSDAES